MNINHKEILNQIPGLVAIKSRESVIQYANDSAAKLAGFECGDEMIGLKDTELKCDASNHSVKFREQDLYVLEHGHLNSIDIIRFADNVLHMILSQKKQFILNNEVSVIYLGTDITGDFQLSLCQQFASLNSEYIFTPADKQQSLFLEKQDLDVSTLTIRQFEVLFFILRGYSSKEIGKQINLSTKTIESHIERIKLVAGCHTRSEMIEWALAQGLFVLLPSFKKLMPW